MTDGIKRHPEAKRREDQWQAPTWRVAVSDLRWPGDFPVRVLPWPTAADGDGVTEPPTMDEVWPGRRMMDKWLNYVELTGAPPKWWQDRWEVCVWAASYGIKGFAWPDLTPITPTTRLTVETTDPDEVRRRLGEVGRIVEGDDG